MWKFLQFLAIALLCQVTAFAQNGSSVVVVINGEPITELDLSKRMKLVMLSSGIQNGPQAMKVLKPQVMLMLMDEKLISQEASRLGIEADEQEITRMMENLANSNKLSLVQFDEFLKHKGIDKDSLEEQIKHQILWSELVTNKIKPTIQVSTIEIEENEESIRKALRGKNEKIEQVRLAEIVLFVPEKEVEKRINFAQKLSDDLRAGADFAKVAKEFSLASSAANGGDIGWVYVNQLAPEIAEQILKLNKGGVTYPIISQDGIHLFKMQDVKKKATSSIPEINEEQVKEAIMEQKLNLAIRSYVNKLRQNAYIKINQ